MSLARINKQLEQLANPETAQQARRFFKTGTGEYGEGDVFRGIKMAQLRKLSREFCNLNYTNLRRLVRSPYHEDRMVALLILVLKYQKANEKEREEIYRFYVRHMKYINNWDLVDLTAEHIIGAWLENRSKKPLYDWAKSPNFWERRIAILSTFHYIKKNHFGETLEIARMLLDDDHDLIHKAVGWMLREVGKRDVTAEEGFLKKHYERMPRTMLRYAIERFPESKRQAYLRAEI